MSVTDNVFRYWGLEGFKGAEKFDILTYDNGHPIKGVISTITVNVAQNTAPELVAHQSVVIPANAGTFHFNLAAAQDGEGDTLSYTLLSSPASGTLSCAMEKSRFKCSYTLPENFRNSMLFSYKANDGTVDSGNSSQVVLRSLRPNSIITNLVSGKNHSCALFNEGNIRCWGLNDYGQLGYGHTRNIGDDEIPLSEGDVSVGEKVVQLSLGNDFTCALLESGNIKCWGRNTHGQLGMGTISEISRNQEPFTHPHIDIDFETSLKVVSIASGAAHSCALFENGQVKCWGGNNVGQLGLGHRYTIGDGEQPRDVDFTHVGGRAVGLALGSDFSCALLEDGKIRCWGYNRYGQLGLGHTHDYWRQ